MLGPPKNAFATTTRNGVKSHNSPSRAPFGSFNGDTPRSEHQKDKSNKETEKVDNEESKSRENRIGTTHPRKHTKEDSEAWTGLRSGKALGSTDGERSFRRNGERESGQEKPDGGDSRRTTRGFDNHRRDLNRESDETGTPRRAGFGRGTKPSWYRDEDPRKSPGAENRSETTRARDWRDGERVNRRGGERDWNRGGKPEQDPEWMQESDVEEKKQTHTADDIEQWKAKMRANKGTAGRDELGEDSIIGHTRTTSGVPLEPSNRKIDKPLVLDPTVDKFFGLWNQPVSGNGTPAEVGSEEYSKPDTGRLIAPRSSRFTGFFSPKPEPHPPQPSIAEPSASLTSSFEPPRNSSNEDKEGFQRILQMLGSGNVSSNGVGSQPSTYQSSKPTTSNHVVEKPQTITPPSERTVNHAQGSPTIVSPRSRRSITLDNLLGSRQPTNEGSLPTNSDSEFLLNLMRANGSDAQQSKTSHQRQPQSNAPGILPYLSTMGHMSHRVPDEAIRSAFLDEPSIDDLQPRDKLNPTANVNRRDPRSLPGPFDDYGESIANRPLPMSVPVHFGIPPGLQRPPGFEQMPPNFNQHVPQPRSAMVASPPGFPNPNRNLNPFPPGLIPNMSSLNISSDRGVPLNMRPMGPMSAGGQLPPAFMGGLPPGFPLVPMQPGGRMSPTRPLFFPSEHPRSTLDMFGDVGPFVNGGRGAYPGQFRRPE